MDGVPGVTQEAILPGKEFIYEFIARPEGIRFYHKTVESKLKELEQIKIPEELLSSDKEHE